MANPSGLTRWSVDPVARQSRPMFPVFGGISGSTRTTLNIGAGIGDAGRDQRSRLQLARDEFLQLHDVRRELPDSFRRFLRRHRVVVKQISELFLVQLEPLDIRLL